MVGIAVIAEILDERRRGRHVTALVPPLVRPVQTRDQDLRRCTRAFEKVQRPLRNAMNSTGQGVLRK